MLTSTSNPILATLRRWDADPAAWAKIFNDMDSGKRITNKKVLKQVLSACQVGPARLVPYDDSYVIKGGRGGGRIPYEETLEGAINHAQRVLNRYVSMKVDVPNIATVIAEEETE